MPQIAISDFQISNEIQPYCALSVLARKSFHILMYAVMNLAGFLCHISILKLSL